MSLTGLLGGLVMPSRDLIVREVTPPGSFGKVFAFVTTGYHVAGILAPLLYGALLDHGAPRSVFYFTAAFTVAGDRHGDQRAEAPRRLYDAASRAGAAVAGGRRAAARRSWRCRRSSR